MTANFDCSIFFATSAAKDLPALKRYLPTRFSLRRYESLTPRAARPLIDILLLDFTHPIGSTDQILHQLESTEPKHAVILADTVRTMESFPFATNPVERVCHHPGNPKDYRKLAQCLVEIADPEAEKKFSEAEFDRASKNLGIKFRNGQFFKFPAIVVKDLNPARIKRVRISGSGHEIIIEQTSGGNLNIPWDFVRYHCDPGYAYYHQKDNPTLADRIGRNIKALRARKNISSYDLALKTGIERPNIARIETAKTNPNLTTLEKIAHALQVSPIRLLG